MSELKKALLNSTATGSFMKSTLAGGMQKVATKAAKTAIADRAVSEPEAKSNAAETLSEVTYEHLSISPFELVEINDVVIQKDINEHGTLHFTGIVPEEVKDDYIFSSNYGTVVKLVQFKDNEQKVLFSGLLMQITVQQEGELYRITGDAITHTYLMDVTIKRRSFQNINETYNSLIRRLTNEYHGDVGFMVDKGAVLGGFTIQYKETDWQFIKRMASHFNEGLYPDFSGDIPRYFFGAPNLGNRKAIDEHVYSVKKDLADYRYLSSNYIAGVMHLDYVAYEVETYIQLELAEQVTYRGLDLYVKSVRAEMQEGVFRFIYKICTRNGLKQKYFEDRDLQGVAVFGHIIGVQRDQVKVHIHEIDDFQDTGTAYWFPYSAMYASDDGSGWYCMPEMGDDIRVEFPNTNERDAIAISSISKYDPRKDSNGDGYDQKKDRMGDTEVRYIRNPQGMEVTLTPTQVIISSNGTGIITLDENGQIMITAQEELTVKAGKDINIKAGESMTIEAADELKMQCMTGSIVMNKDGNVYLKGNEVYQN